MNTKKMLVAMLASVTIFSTSVLPVAATTIETSENTIAEATVRGVDLNTLNRVFPDGVPKGLSDDEVAYILAGNYYEKDSGEILSIFNPDNNPNQMVSRKAESWDVDLAKNTTWYPPYAACDYRRNPLFGSIQASTKYHVAAQDDPDDVKELFSWGRAWVKITANNGQSSSDTAENSSKFPYKSITATRAIGGDFAEEIRFSYRNLRTDWNEQRTVY